MLLYCITTGNKLAFPQLSRYNLSFQHGSSAAGLTVAEQYVDAFSNLAKVGNTILLPSNAGEVSSMVTQV